MALHKIPRVVFLRHGKCSTLRQPAYSSGPQHATAPRVQLPLCAASAPRHREGRVSPQQRILRCSANAGGPRSSRSHRWRCGSSGSSGGGGGGAAEMDELVYGSSDEVPLAKLQQRLEAAIDEEDYAAAAQLRDVIQRRRFDGRLAVEEANQRFYAAFQSGSLAEMYDVWGKGEHVQCIHPLSGCLAGRQTVMESWKLILGSGRMSISIQDVRIFASDSQAFVTCVELTEAGDSKGRIAATNVFERQGGVWKLVHHHGSPLPPGMR